MNTETTEYRIECRNLALSNVFYETDSELGHTYEDAIQKLLSFRRMFSGYQYQYRLVQIHRNEHGTPTCTVLDV